MRRAVAIAAVALVSMPTPQAAERVTIDNFKRAETHNYMQARVSAGCFGKLCHERKTRGVDEQEIVRLNRDTIYSSGVFDLTAPLTITLPDPKGRFQSLLVINEDHYVPLVAYGPKTVTLTQDVVGSRYVYLAFRTFADPNDPKDVSAAHALQDQLAVAQSAAGSFSVPEWDKDQREKLRKELMDLAPYNPDPLGRFGAKDRVDAVRHLVGTASGWGGNPPEDAQYLSRFVPQNDGTANYTLTLKDVPVDAFWSVTVYNAKGFYEAPENAISVNSVTAKKDTDGSVVIHFGGDATAANYLRVMPGWNYLLRLYRPRPEVLKGTWKAPEAQLVR